MGRAQAIGLPGLLAKYWGIERANVRPLAGGMNSRTWEVRTSSARWVAKLVPMAQRDAFRAGLEAAAVVEAAGVPAGAAVPTNEGSWLVELDPGCLALLTFVDGAPLTGTNQHEQCLIGETLGAVHRALAGTSFAPAPRLDWIDTEAPHLGVEAWVRPAVCAEVARWDALASDLPSWGLLHGDPAPEAFRCPPGSSRCSLIDWSSAFFGPLLYDLASAVMYVGGPGEAGARW